MNDIIKHEIEYRGKDILPLLNKNIAICGCGAIGSNLADTLARQGFTNFTLIDFDRVEEKNIGTQAYSHYHVGLLKVAALEDIIWNINEQTQITSKNIRLNEKNIGKLIRDADIIIDAFDNTNSRQLLKDYGHNGFEVFHGGMFEGYAECIWNDNYKVPLVKEGLDVCDYPLARNIVTLLTTVMAEEIMSYLITNDKRGFCITLRDLKITKL